MPWEASVDSVGEKLISQYGNSEVFLSSWSSLKSVESVWTTNGFLSSSVMDGSVTEIHVLTLYWSSSKHIMSDMWIRSCLVDLSLSTPLGFYVLSFTHSAAYPLPQS